MSRHFHRFRMALLAGIVALASILLGVSLPAFGQTDASASPKNSQPPAQRLPEPKPSDYGAATFNAPSDTALNHFMASHQPPQPPTGKADANQPGKPSSSGANTGNTSEAGNGKSDDAGTKNSPATGGSS